MQELHDNALLREYVEYDSQEAFATIVARHVNKVYSVALRHTRNPHQAEEITQAVFVILAQKARHLGKGVILSGWLYQTARLTAMTFIRSEIRRARREQEAHLQTLSNESESDVWSRIAPLLDVAMAGLNETDRHAVVLRFFDGRSIKEVGAILGASEDATKMRVSRAVEKLRGFFTKRRIVLSAAVLTAAISTNSVQAAPAVLAKAATAIAFTKGATASTPTLTLIKGALKLMAWTKIKTAAVAGGVILLAVGTTTMVIHQRGNHLPKPQPVAYGQTEFPKATWRFAGYNDPESAFMSLAWAIIKNDDETLLNGVSPAVRKSFAGKADPIGARDRADFAKMTGYRIVEKQVLSEDEVVLAIEPQSINQTQRFSMKRINGEWKFGGKAK